MEKFNWNINSIIQDQLNNIFESTLKNIKEKHEIRGLLDELNESINSKIRDDNYETILSKGAFSQFVKNYNVISNIFEYVFGDKFKENISEDSFLIGLTTKCKNYLEYNGINVNICESSNIYSLFQSILFKIKDFQEKFTLMRL